MNDFLSSIVARALKTIPVVTPRPVAHFEPAGNRNPTLTEQVGETESSRTNPRTPASPSPLSAVIDSPTSASFESETVPGPADGSEHSVRPTGFRTAERAAAKEPVGALARSADPFREHSGARQAQGQKWEKETSGERIPQTQRQPRSAPVASPWPQAQEVVPSIHVSIGRVEVRAIHRAEKPLATRNAPEPPRVSLGAYLRGRQD